jgi:hypothetical protein
MVFRPYHITTPRPIAAEPRGGTELFLFHSRSSSHTPLLLGFRYEKSVLIPIEA